MITRPSLEKPIALVFTLLAFWVCWQAVRFCQGNAPVPGLEEPVFDVTNLLQVFGSAYYYIIGIAVWLSAGGLIMFAGQILSRWVAVGSQQLLVDMRQSWAEEQRLAKIATAQRKRREIRRKLRKEKVSGNTTGAFIVGTILGVFFF